MRLARLCARAFQPLELGVCGLAPRCSRMRRISGWLFWAANSTAVAPSFCVASTFAPPLSSASMQSACPFRAAMRSAVAPSLVVASRLAPASTSTRTTLTCPS